MTTTIDTPPAPTWRDVADQLTDIQRAALAEVERRGIHTAWKLLDLALDMAGDPAGTRRGPAPRPLPPAWAGLVDEYLAAEAGAGRTSQTLATRRSHLSSLARGIQCTPATVTSALILAWYGQQTWGLESRRGHRNTAVSFFGWAYRAGHLPTNAGADLPVMRPAVPAPRPAPDTAWFAALAAAEPRIRLMLRLAAEAGLRRAEIARVHRNDLTDGAAGAELLVHGKGGKLRVIPISDDLAAAIADAADWLFPGDDEGHLSPQYVGKLMAGALPDHWTAHTLRHRFATRAYRGTRNLRAVQTLLGHSSVATTERYTAVDADEVRAAMMAATSPYAPPPRYSVS